MATGSSVIALQKEITIMSWKKSGGIWGLVMYLTQSSVLGQTAPLTIEELLLRVEENSKEIALADLEVSISEVDARQAKINQLPSLSVFGAMDKASNMPVYVNGIFQTPIQHDVVHTLYYSGANLYLNLFEGYKVKNEIKRSEILEELAQVSKEKQVSLIKLKAVHLFIDLYLQHQWKLMMENDITEKQQELEEIASIHKAGIVVESDVLRAELELSKRKMTLVEIENSIVVIRQQLNVLMGAPDESPITPEISFVEEDASITLQEALAAALSNGFDSELSHLHTQVAETNLKLTTSANYPKVGLAGSFQFSNPQIFLYPYNFNWYSLGLIGIKASYSISNLYHNKKQVQRARIELESEELHHMQVNDEVRTRVYRAFYAYDEAVKNQKVSEQNQIYANENARILKNAYFKHTTLITDLLDANLLQVKASFELEQAKMNILKNSYTLKFETGQL